LGKILLNAESFPDLPQHGIDAWADGGFDNRVNSRKPEEILAILRFQQ
jgi:hypothetical protein